MNDLRSYYQINKCIRLMVYMNYLNTEAMSLRYDRDWNYGIFESIMKRAREFN